VVVIGRYEGRHHITQKPMQATAAHVYDLKDGKVSRFRMFADTKPISESCHSTAANDPQVSASFSSG
jgi:uncharacterized protein